MLLENVIKKKRKKRKKEVHPTHVTSRLKRACYGVMLREIV